MSAGFLDVDRARGLLLGLLLGDAGAHRATRVAGEPGVLFPTAASQLACFTVDGLIRGHLRMAHRGIGHPPSMVWRSFQQWAFLQGLMPAPVGGGGTGWLPGWLSQVAPLAEHRGTAPATVGALVAGRQGSPDQSVGSSAGHHALSNAAPAALFSSFADVREVGRQIAALTHARRAQAAARDGVALLAIALRDAGVSARGAAAEHEGPPGTAADALRHGVEAAAEHPGADDFLTALAAADSTGGEGAATFAGALWGAAHGAPALPQDLISRLELGTVADTLARDATVEQVEQPSGSEYEPNPDRWWENRYPGF